MSLPAILSLDFTRPQYQKGSISLSGLNKLASTNRTPVGSAVERVVIRLNALAIALRALNAESVADELNDIASEVGHLPVLLSKPVPTSSAMRESLSKLPPVSRPL